MAHPNTTEQFDSDDEYRAIEATLLETARGRWFLAEHGKRARRLDSALLEDAIDRLKGSLRQPPALLGQLQAELETITGFLAETRTELFAKPQMPSASSASMGNGDAEPLPEPVTPTGGILKVAEDIHELAWALQADHISTDTAEAIARHATQIYAMSHQHAVECEKTKKMAVSLDDASQRLAALLQTVAHELVVDTDVGRTDVSDHPAQPASGQGWQS